MIRHKFDTLIISLAGIVGMTSAALAGPPKEHFDIWLRPITGANGPQIATGSITEGTPGDPVNEIERVFGAELGEDPSFPYSAEEPGMQSLAGPLTAGMLWGFNITAPLGVWNGDGFATAGESMLIEFGPASVTSGAGFVPGFTFSGNPDGLMHTHFDFTLQSPTLAGNPNDGIYLLALEFDGMNGATIYAASDAIFLVFNLNADEEDHETAIEWVQGNLLPAPGALGLLLIVARLGSKRRQRHR